MTVYLTEEEQLENIKKWWRNYGNVVTWSLCAALLVVASAKYWFWHTAKIKQQASITYESMIDAYNKHDNNALASYANQLTKNYNNTVYAEAAELLLAKIAIQNGELENAGIKLQNVINRAKSPSLIALAQIRYARIQIALKNYEKAQQILNHINNLDFKPLIAETKGDLYVKMGNNGQAHTLYQEAAAGFQAANIANPYLQMKISALAGTNS